MITPFWYQCLWAASALAYLGVCVVVVRNRQLSAWPSVFALSANRFAWFIVGRILLSNYTAYFYGYYAESVVIVALSLWLAADIYRSIPASGHLGKSFKRTTVVICAFFAAAVSSILFPSLHSSTEVWLSRLALMGDLMLAGTASAALLWFTVNGLGQSSTGFFITSGALARLASSMVKSHATAYATAHQMPMNKLIETADLLVSLGVALYWGLAFGHNLRRDRQSSQDWKRFSEQIGIPHDPH